MKTGRVAAVFAQGAVWRATGSRAAGEALVRAFTSDDEMVKVLAGMFLVKGGRRAAPVIRHALVAGGEDPELITALADVGSAEDAPLLRRFEASSDPRVAGAARDALGTLRLREATEARMAG